MGTTDDEMVRVAERIVLLTACDSHQPLPVVAQFSFSHIPQYESFCDDFGPMNLAAIFRFCEQLEKLLESHETGDIAFISPPDSRSLTNAVFLLGAYLVMKLEYTASQVEEIFDTLRHRIASYRDVSPGPQDFHLQLRDCWEGIERAKQIHWISFAPGDFNLFDYEECDNPLNADLHEVVPGKFIAMRGPRALPLGHHYLDDPSGARYFNPGHYAEILHQFDVQAIVRLNEALYDAADFESLGLAVADLPFEDCAPPPPALSAAFLAIAEGIPGALAVHCSAGLGRTGTLIAMYMMKHHGFTARQAMGWLRVVRPGSVIGSQQAFLCDAEPALRRAGQAFRRRAGGRPAVGVAPDAPVADVSAFVAAAAAAATARAAELLRTGSSAAAAGLPLLARAASLAYFDPVTGGTAAPAGGMARAASAGSCQGCGAGVWSPAGNAAAPPACVCTVLEWDPDAQFAAPAAAADTATDSDIPGGRGKGSPMGGGDDDDADARGRLAAHVAAAAARRGRRRSSVSAEAGDTIAP